MNHLLIIPQLLPATAGMLNLLLADRGPGLQRLVSLCATATLLPVTILLLGLADNGAFSVYQLGNWPAPFGIVLVLDRAERIALAGHRHGGPVHPAVCLQ